MAEQAAPRRSSAPPAGRILADRYALLSSLGRGSMGSVWIAEDRRLGRRVAVKILGSLWAKSSDARRRFEREAMAVAKLQSPHIVQVFDYGIYGKRPYIVMELISGEDLQTRLAREGRLGLEKTAAIVLQVCRGLHVAHKAGLVHRDLKPGNVMIDTSTGEELVKVLDFGVAKAPADKDTEATKDGIMLGTPKYMAPEQARALPDVDHRADLWSLGVIAFSALTGRAPFLADSVADMVVQICTAPLPRATELCPELPPLVDVFFERALARRRDERFDSAYAFASSFFRVLGAGSPAMSLSAIVPGGIGEISSDPGGDSFPLPGFGPAATSQPGLESRPGLGGEPAEAPPRPVVSEPGLVAADAGVSPTSETLASDSGAPLVDQSPADSLATEAAMVDDVTGARRPGKLALGVGVAAVAAVAVGAFFALRAPVGPATRQHQATASSSPGAPSASETAATATSSPASRIAAVPATAGTTVATASAPPAADTAPPVAPTATGHVWTAPTRSGAPIAVVPSSVPKPSPTAAPATTKPPGETDLLGERY